MDDATLIRFALGASGDNAGLLDDAEIELALDTYEDWRLAAATIAEALAARAINDPASFALTGVMAVSWADRAKSWMSIARSLREEALRLEQQSVAPVGMQVGLLRRERWRSDEIEYMPGANTWRLER